MSRVLRALRRKWFPPSLQPANLAGYTVLVTGANVGLGFEAALKYVSLGASTVILGVRNMEKGNAAKDAIEARTQRRGVVKVWHLDMDRFSSVKAFADRVDAEVDRLDIALLNAGLQMRAFATSPEGWEETLQVNLLSTVLLGLLLLPKLRASRLIPGESSGSATESQIPRDTRDTTHNIDREDAGQERTHSPISVHVPHLTIVASNAYKMVPPGDWETASDYLQLHNTPENYNGTKQYAWSKLLLMYAVDELARLAASPLVSSLSSSSSSSSSSSPPPSTTPSSFAQTPPPVIVTSLCPGFCWSDLARDYSGTVFEIAKYMLYGTLGKSSEVGSRTLVNASLLGPEAHGMFYDVESIVQPAEIVSSEKAQMVIQPKVWAEILGVLKEKVPGVAKIVDAGSGSGSGSGSG